MLADVIEIIAAHWDDVLRHLGAAERKTLIVCARDFLAGGGAASRYDAAQRMVDLVAPALPADHLVRRAIAREGNKFGSGLLDWSPAVRMLGARLGSAGDLPALTSLAAPPEPGEIVRAAQESILAVPSVTEAQVRDRGVDPNAPGLIRLSTTGGDVRLPAFQFDAGGYPYPVVTQINLLLDVADDPWGVADWWLGPNGWIGAVPAESIGHIDDRLLVAAARAVYEEG
jgi:hypothetical protein